MQRVKQSTGPVPISETWYQGGVVADPGTTTIGITRDDGTVLVAPGAATSGSGAAARTYNLTTAHTGLLDKLTVHWTTANLGTSDLEVEVVGDFLFTAAEGMAVVPGKTDAEVEQARIKAEQDIERACRVAFVPRYESQILSGDGTGFLQVRWPQVRSIRSITVGGTTVSVTDLEPTQAGLYNPSGWTRGVSNVVVRYEHGYDPGEIQAGRAALRLAKHYLLGSPTDDRAVRMDTDVGSYALATAGMRGARFGIPEVDAFVQAERYVLSVA